uniref:Exo-alpha-sialidase n=1 Tax=uncultured prokaryote AT3 TaxID=672202 RepID=D3W8F9_9ZZZZ|nr:conserved hypothetical protein [uncultured prokaryote AT3]
MIEAIPILRRVAVAGLLVVLVGAGGVIAADADQHQHAATPQRKARPELGTSAAIDALGRWWAVLVDQGRVELHQSADGAAWSRRAVVSPPGEAVSANGESRPKLAFGRDGLLYIAWTSPTAGRFNGDIRFARSLDGGQTFTPPLTVHADRSPITHRFESMLVDAQGRIFIAWLDRRDNEAAKGKGELYAGFSVYYAVSADDGASWRGDYRLAAHSCECCRIALSADRDGQPLAMWRQIFDGERDHALARLNPDGAPAVVERATFDHWRVNACPDHGPGIAVDGDGVRHAVWFNQREGQAGVFYGRLLPGRVEGQQRLPDGAQHADIVADGVRVWVVWKRFDGEQTLIEGQVSADGGQHWSPLALASTRGDSDQPRLLSRDGAAWLVWRTRDENLVVRRLP